MVVKHRQKRPKIALFGHFGARNFGNESTFQAMLCHVRRLLPDAEVTCICTWPETVAEDYGIVAVPMNALLFRSQTGRSSWVRGLRKLLIGIPSELHRWLSGVITLWGADTLIIPGTGLLTDAFSVGGWGPYSTFKWSVIAKVCRCRLVFLSVGAGPLNSTMGRLLVKATLYMSDFRSYRDIATAQYLKHIGFQSGYERLYPDLAFSLPQALLPQGYERNARMVVGLGLMDYGGMYGVESTTREDYRTYLEALAGFVEWLLHREYDVRLLIGDLADMPVIEEFKALLSVRGAASDPARVVADPITSAQGLLSQLAMTDFVVGTRFHNVLLALLLNKPSMAISFHHKSSSLMSQMGLSEYCQDIKGLRGDKLIEQFCQLERNATGLKSMIGEKVEGYRRALDEQYALVFDNLLRVPEQSLSKQDVDGRGEVNGKHKWN